MTVYESSILWFRSQLRVHDQPLFESRGGEDRPVVGVWVFDPREHLELVDGFPRAGSRRVRFLLESVESLRTSLRELGSELIVRVGEPEQVIPELAAELNVDSVIAFRQPGTEERGIERLLAASLGPKWKPLGYESVLEVEDLDVIADELPEVFSRFRRHVEKKIAFARPRETPSSLAIPQLPSGFDVGGVPDLRSLGYEVVDADERSVMDFKGGESQGLDRLHSWMFDHDNLQRYKQTRNGMLGEAYSSKFSPWLANGCLSGRFVVSETLRYERQRLANESTYWLRFEILWREYFRLYLMKHGPSMFLRGGPVQSDLAWGDPEGRFESWRTGETGVPLVDANMIELSTTGFMSNRGRQIVASFLSKNLDVDWRRGARWFEHCLIDYCPSANWGNWTYAAGVGADPRGFRGFDVARQAANYDPTGDYVAAWLGDRIGSLPVESRHAPWLAGGPTPIVDPERSLSEAKRRWDQLAAGD
ncbi:MAG: cryptochrome DASH [Phycisphaerae bacterium]|nr:cryptochrome DASH [Phycisphaerae bacterium]MDG1899727.1 DASH family cryptochrome [Phycisphaerales bacterium]|tara:strand:+ start:8038 stop:9468 length:1431 start_codon:yes stop_codon:yes gene_type:complete